MLVVISGLLMPNKGEKMRNCEKLKVWEKAHQLVLNVYQATASFPAVESYGPA